jgi:hypothetical protein
MMSRVYLRRHGCCMVIQPLQIIPYGYIYLIRLFQSTNPDFEPFFIQFRVDRPADVRIHFCVTIQKVRGLEFEKGPVKSDFKQQAHIAYTPVDKHRGMAPYCAYYASTRDTVG